MNDTALASYVQWLWLVPVLPLCAGILSALLPLSQKRLAFFLTVGALSASSLVAFWCLSGVLAHPEAGPATLDVTWLRFGTTALELGLLLNPLTAVMIAVVTPVSLLIVIYSHGYMHDDARYARFFCFLALFSSGMLGLTVANSLVLLFVSWEVVGVCSYLLIGFWYEKPSAAAAAKKAFITTKIGDIGFLLGILWLYRETGTQLLYAGGHGALETTQLQLLAHPAGFGLTAAAGVALLLFCGAVGKSGQFPLHVWLPDAMEGPTPVSALIHAATMVAAGVFLVARVLPIFDVAPGTLDVVAWIGAFTSLFAATIAVAQNDIKRILAYSTVSQLGLMMLGLAYGGVVAGMFHLVTHAFFKALLFLGAGSVIHGSHHEQDIMKMGGLKSEMKVTFITYLVGAAALAGVFPLAGFWSKDDILLSALHAGSERGAVAWVPFAMAVAASFLTAFYMTRQVALVFFGSKRGHAHSHESPAVMLVPLVVLAVFAALFGLVGTPWANGFHHFLAPHEETPAASIPFMLGASALAFAGIGGGWLLYGRKPLAAGEADPLARFQPLHGWLQRRWMIDELYEATFIRGGKLLARLSNIVDGLLDTATQVLGRGGRFLSRGAFLLDEIVVRGVANGLGASVRRGGHVLSRFQSGRVQTYLALVSLAATLLLVVWLVLGFLK